MRAIILAAGMGSRMGDCTRDKPKCLVELGGKTLLDHQLEVLKQYCDDLVIVRGHCADKIKVAGVRYCDNKLFDRTNMVGSLMCARSWLENDCLVVYGDIVYEAEIVEKVVRAPCDIGVVVDEDYKKYWDRRFDGDTSCDCESLRMDIQGRIVDIGRPISNREDMHARYVGMLKFSGEGSQRLLSVHDKLAAEDNRTKWYNSASFQQAYMTDMLQAVVDAGHEVQAIRVRRGWLEVDSQEDLLRYESWIRSGEIARYFRGFGNIQGSIA